MSDIEFVPGATFSEEENGKLAMVLERMEAEEQELEALKHAPIIPPGARRQEFPRFTPIGLVTIAKRPVLIPAVPAQKKMEETNPEVKEVPSGPKAGGQMKPEVKIPAQFIPAKAPEEWKKAMWVQRAAAQPPKKQPKQRQQEQASGQHQ